MTTATVDVYAALGAARPAGTKGVLTCWHAATPAAVSARRRKPAVLILPGGGYAYCSQREAEPVALRFAAAGYAAFVLEYSCAPFAFPTALREAALAMRYIRAHADEFEADPQRVAALGFSAGGHLCGTLGTMYDAPELAGFGPAAAIRPDALVLCYPVAVSHGRTHAETFANISGGDTALAARLSLDALARPDMPPVFLWHTRDDGAVPCRNALELARALEQNGVDFALHVYRHGPHGLSTADAMVYPAHAVPEMSPDVPGWLAAVQQFLAEHGFAVTDKEGEV